MGIVDRYGNDIMRLGGINLANAAERRHVKSVTAELLLQTQALTKKDIKSWRTAWQQAINVENPMRVPLYAIYQDTDIDFHLTGCVGQRTGMVMSKSFKMVDDKGKENPEVTNILEAPWFKSLVSLSLQSRYYGHSLIQLGDIITINGKPAFDGVRLIPRQHVKPEFGVIVREQSDDWRKGYDYRHSTMTPWCIEAGGEYDLGLYLKASLHTISKKNMAAFWDQFGEIFGMPVRIAHTASRDPNDKKEIIKMLDGMGAAAYGLFPEGTEIDIKETSRGDAFNIYDKRIERANSEISKGILNQTMTIDAGASLSQSEVHLRIFENIVAEDADFICDLINYQLIPRMLIHGFPVGGLRFAWDESIDYTPEQQLAIEELVAKDYDVDPKYYIEKYNIPVIGKKTTPALPVQEPGEEDDKKKQKLFFD